jgi:hypothetical protein
MDSAVIGAAFVTRTCCSPNHGLFAVTADEITTPPTGACGVALAWFDSGPSPLGLVAVTT